MKERSVKTVGFYFIDGGKKLSGSVRVQGSKNSAVAVLISSLITEKTVKISGLPDISDVFDCISILKLLGCEVIYYAENTLIINTENASPRPLPSELLSRMRASSYLIGALLGRFGSCETLSVGGCNFGSRPLNYHISAMEALGAVCKDNGEYLTIEAKNGLYGSVVEFPEKTVGGTVNTIIAAARASGKTVIKNAAREPHVSDVCAFLNAAGAEIRGAGTDEITVIGQPALHGAEFSVSTDMIEAGTYLFAALISGGEVRCEGAPVEHLSSVLDVLKEMNAEVRVCGDTVSVCAENLAPTSVSTAPYPGFPTDLHPQLAVLMSKARGISRINEAVFRSRFQYTEPLKRLGMKCDIDGSVLTVIGGTRLVGGTVKATDLRGGAALILAALSAKGTTIIENTHFISRGYSDTVKKLTSLGAEIRFSESL